MEAANLGLALRIDYIDVVPLLVRQHGGAGDAEREDRLHALDEDSNEGAIDEIAVVLKSNSNATKNTVFRAVAKLRKALEPFVEARRAVGARRAES